MDSKDQNMDLTRTKRIHFCPFQFILFAGVRSKTRFWNSTNIFYS